MDRTLSIDILDRLTQYVDRKEFSQAVSLLDKIRTHRWYSHWPLNGLSGLLYAEARLSYNRGQYVTAKRKVRAALRLAKRANDDSLYASEKLLHGLILQAQGDLESASESYLESYVFRKRANEVNRLCVPLNNLGLIHLVRGSLSQAQDNFDSALGHARLHNSAPEIEMCRINLAITCMLRGDFLTANGHLSELMEKCSEGLNRYRVQELSCRLKVFKLELDDALREYRQVITKFKCCGALREVAICLEFIGLAHHLKGNHRQAKKCYQEILGLSEPTASAIAQTQRMLCDVYLAEGDLVSARETATKADLAIGRIKEQIEFGALLRTYGKLHGLEGDLASARTNFAKSISLLGDLGAKYELAITHLEIGNLECVPKQERLAALYQSRSLFVEMCVSKRIEQIDSLIVHIEAGKQPRRIVFHKSSEKSPAAPTIVAASQAMKQIMSLADRVKDSDLTILITGETGTGKDLLAEYIHKTSNRAAGPYVVTNCAALPEALIEAELFGYRRGSYSGASSDKPGLIESANGGTFVLDEIGEIPVPLQAKLLRVIDTKIIRRIGEVTDSQIDVRFLALTNRDLGQMVREGNFRSDLYHRLCQMPIHLPPLRERPEDILPLAKLLLDRHGLHANGDTPQLLASMHEHLIACEWPGNVRELNAIVMRVATLLGENGNGDVIGLLQQQLGAQDAEGNERRRLFEALRHNNGNKSRAAQDLGIPVTTLKSRLKRFSI